MLVGGTPIDRTGGNPMRASVGGHHDVAVEGEVGAAGQAVAVHLGDDRDAAVPDPGPAGAQLEHGRRRRPRCRRAPPRRPARCPRGGPRTPRRTSDPSPGSPRPGSSGSRSAVGDRPRSSRMQRGVSGLWRSGRLRVSRQTAPIRSMRTAGSRRAHRRPGGRAVWSSGRPSARAARLTTLPAALRGSAVTRCSRAGHLVVGQPVEEEGAQVSAAVVPEPSDSTTQAPTSSPSTSWGMPATAASTTSGWAKSTSSTSPGAMLWPPRMIRSFVRPVIQRKPSSSR